MKKVFFIICIIFFSTNIQAQTWIDSLDVFGREVFMPADQYKWDWGQATMMNAMVHLYNAKPELQKRIYLD
jgi:hypothetical protein